MKNPAQRSDRTAPRTVLNAGSGPASPLRLHPVFRSSEWAETRLDLNPDVAPDLLGSIVDLGRMVADAAFDAIWCSHNLEHLYAYEVVPTLAKFRRALKPDGFALVTCPDLEAVSRLVLEHGLDATIYESAAGPITCLDMIYGHIRSVAEGNKLMCHHCGFTAKTLGAVALRAGFTEARVSAADDHALWALFLMPEARLDDLTEMFQSTSQAYLLEDRARRSEFG